MLVSYEVGSRVENSGKQLQSLLGSPRLAARSNYFPNTRPVFSGEVASTNPAPRSFRLARQPGRREQNRAVTWRPRRDEQVRAAVEKRGKLWRRI